MSSFTQQLATIAHPTLIVDEQRCQRNIARMGERARRNHVQLRPHFKTHQAAHIGAWFRAENIHAITVSSLRMAAYFAEHDWSDITVAFPINWREMDLVHMLAQRIQLGVLVDSVDSMALLTREMRTPIHVWLEIDAGYHRTGFDWENTGAIQQALTAAKSNTALHIQGLLTHSGHSYRARSAREINQLYDETLHRLQAVCKAVSTEQPLMLSIGDTPTCSVVEDFSAVDEIRPGNFAYYDVMQTVIGSCTAEDIAVAVACPVVSKNAARQEIAVYGGGVHLSKDSVITYDGKTNYGLIALPTETGWTVADPANYVFSLSQEHGLIHVEPAVFDQLQLGDLVLVLPVHSCMTADLLKGGITTSGHTFNMMPTLPIMT